MPSGPPSIFLLKSNALQLTRFPGGSCWKVNLKSISIEQEKKAVLTLYSESFYGMMHFQPTEQTNMCTKGWHVSNRIWFFSVGQWSPFHLKTNQIITGPINLNRTPIFILKIMGIFTWNSNTGQCLTHQITAQHSFYPVQQKWPSLKHSERSMIQSRFFNLYAQNPLHPHWKETSITYLFSSCTQEQC